MQSEIHDLIVKRTRERLLQEARRDAPGVAGGSSMSGGSSLSGGGGSSGGGKHNAKAKTRKPNSHAESVKKVMKENPGIKLGEASKMAKEMRLKAT